MSQLPAIRLKRGKDTPIRAGHPWVFSNALAGQLDGPPGLLIKLLSHAGAYVGTGMYNPLTSIRVRLLSLREDEEIDAGFFRQRLQALYKAKRERLGEGTNGFRLAHGDADGLPGFIADVYDDICVFQIHSAGMDRLREDLIAALGDGFGFRAVVERSDVSARRLEGLKDGPTAVHIGSVEGLVKFRESGLSFWADVLRGQKTGFFLDQRDARRVVMSYAKGRRVLNLFSYSGAFSVYAAAGGAAAVTSLDISEEALRLARENFRLNGLAAEDANSPFIQEDAFAFTAEARVRAGEYDLVICDPPAFTKSYGKRQAAFDAYGQINAACLAMLGQGGILVTSSCSGVVSMEEFRDVIRLAAGRAGRNMRVLGMAGQPFDHTDRLSFPEGRYLKTLFLEAM